jgi:hypothetical protein
LVYDYSFFPYLISEMKITGKVMTREGAKSNVIVSFSVPKVSNGERPGGF